MLTSNGHPLKMKGLYNPVFQSPHDFDTPGSVDDSLWTRESRYRQGMYSYADFRAHIQSISYLQMGFNREFLLESCYGKSGLL